MPAELITRSPLGVANDCVPPERPFSVAMPEADVRHVPVMSMKQPPLSCTPLANVDVADVPVRLRFLACRPLNVDDAVVDVAFTPRTHMLEDAVSGLVPPFPTIGYAWNELAPVPPPCTPTVVTPASFCSLFEYEYAPPHIVREASSPIIKILVVFSIVLIPVPR